MRLYVIIFTVSIFQIQGLLAEPFLKGYYYGKDMKKVEGLIKFNRATFSAFGSKPASIRFKINSDSKAIKLTIDEIASFVIGRDSFAIVGDFKINSISGVYNKDFAQVLDTGAIKLYLHYSSSSDGKASYDHDRYIITKDNVKYLGIWNGNKQRDEIAAYFVDRPDLKNKVLDKKSDVSFQELVKDYNKNASH